MNIVYIFGNGFDKAQNMATSYPEFYNYLQVNNIQGSLLLEQMKREISRDVELWSDMESGLGDFTDITSSSEDFDAFYFELSDLLRDYLKKENDKFEPTEKLKLKFQEDFTSVGKYLEALDKERYNRFLRNHGYSALDISVITLNYTDTLEKILSLRDNSVTKVFAPSIALNNIIHLHGKLDDSIIIGVDNNSQIKNETFRDNEDILDILIKTKSNEIMKETRHLECEHIIEKANVIVLFGVSLGDTDAKWWQIIGSNLVKRNNLIIIQHIFDPDAITPTRRQKLGKLERCQQKRFMKKMKIKENNWSEDIRNRLFFTVNRPVFKV